MRVDSGQKQHLLIVIHLGTEEGLKETSSNVKTSEDLTNTTSHIPLREVFHTLETDKSAMIEQRKLEVRRKKTVCYFLHI